MSVSEGTATVNGKTVKARLHTYQDPDPSRSEYYGGPKGDGYIEGPMEDIQYLADQKPSELVINNAEGVAVEVLEKIDWTEAEVMWEQDGYVHGLIHLEWM